MALFSRRNIKHQNPFGLTEKDLKGDLRGFPMGVVVRMLEEQELQGNEPDVKVFQNDIASGYDEGGFESYDTEAGIDFWDKVIYYDITECDFDLFFKKYPEYERYNIS